MFHYRLAPSNNRSRMLIAVLLAIVIHMGLMNFEFSPKPVLVPSVSLPHSVSIFLQQNSFVQTSEQPSNKMQDVSTINKAQSTAVKEPELNVKEKSPAIIKKQPSLEQTPVPIHKTANESIEIKEKKETALKAIEPPYPESKVAAEDPKNEHHIAPKAQELTRQVESQYVQQEEGVELPGTLQMAYPRYQDNAPPTYPALARKRGQEGAVILEVLVNRNGRVDELKIDTSSNFTLLDRATVSAVREWSFEPGMRGEEKIPMWVKVPVTFKLK